MITIDVHEPIDKALALIGSAVDTNVEDLNGAGFADYRWQDYTGAYVHAERKTWGELLADLSHVEDQLRRHLSSQANARLLFVLEGVTIPVASGSAILRPANRDAIYIKGHYSSIRLSQVYAWLYQVGKFVEIYTTPNYEATCMALVAFYNGDQKEKHETLHRHIKKVKFHPNFMVTNLMGMLPDIGEKRAEALIEQFTTVWNVVSAKPEELALVPGIGKGLSKTILQRIGRTDV